jgi:hypothetical protein
LPHIIREEKVVLYVSQVSVEHASEKSTAQDKEESVPDDNQVSQCFKTFSDVTDAPHKYVRVFEALFSTLKYRRLTHRVRRLEL